jgi:hypothetical protein
VGQTIEYLAGVYYQTDTLNYQQDVEYTFLSPKILSTSSLAPLIPFLPFGQEIMDPPALSCGASRVQGKYRLLRIRPPEC